LDDLTPVLPDTFGVTAGRASIGGCYLDDLARQFGTPLYVYDRDSLVNAADSTSAAFRDIGARVSYASKACEIAGVLRVFHERGLGLDCVSLGELQAGLRAGFTPNRMHLHGNAKTDDEIDAAVRTGVHALVIDNLDELERVGRVAVQAGTTVRVWLRLALPIEARTHPHLMTSGRYSKFGLGEVEEREALRHIAAIPSIQLTGVHVHLGSQIEEVSIYVDALDALSVRLEQLRARGHVLSELSIGGGWAVRYRPGDPLLDARDVARALEGRVPDGVTLTVEPGRALVARAAVALYRVISVKSTDRGRIVAVDGGMGDNPRPALYGARYTAVNLSRLDSAAEGPADVVGRYCESGDILARDVELPSVRAGDLIAVPVAGAYQLAMASAYNLVPPPAAVMVASTEASLIRRRPSLDDLLALDIACP
jgi:diaminopimelate decarboxylase